MVITHLSNHINSSLSKVKLTDRSRDRRVIPPLDSVDDTVSVTDMSYTDFVDGWNFYGGDLVENEDGMVLRIAIL